jgi:fermentation-respiration switch protein FrsA (DUF1100 family)
VVGLGLGLPLGLLLGYLGVCAVVLDLSLTPNRVERPSGPERDGLVAEAVSFSAPGGPRIDGYFIPGAGERAMVVVHGLDATCQHDEIRRASKMYSAHGFDVLIYDQRGHGRSAGDRLGLAFEERADVLAAVSWLGRRGYAPGAIGLHGFSYGAAAVLLAAPELPQVGAVVADSAFADVRELIDAELARRTGAPGLFTPGVVRLARWLYDIDPEEIPPLRAVPRIAPRPVMLVHGAVDQQVPPDHSERLKAAARGARDILWLVPDADHIEAIAKEPERYAAEVLAFVEANVAPPAPVSGAASLPGATASDAVE